MSTVALKPDTGREANVAFASSLLQTEMAQRSARKDSQETQLAPAV